MEITVNEKTYVLMFDHQSELIANRQYLASTNGKIYSRLSTFTYDIGEALPEGGKIDQIIAFDQMNKEVEAQIESKPKRRRKKTEA
ncbi:hypothetical protein [Flammeovirga pacifica]|uniref:Uncharacterized protein n=1 Tax=Flammeovirga pacifica TaxID=915059 RepID=A0A1S1YUN4_FLAPC|nr:hypothetical protein [Flammeovirga pacifica]OHX64737.1 hypothetical protein NH26_24555 [Flammeovirga pacifica]